VKKAGHASHSIKKSLSGKKYDHQSILTYFKIGFWDGLSPEVGGGLFLLVHL
jgi:hypothetical protein